MKKISYLCLLVATLMAWSSEGFTKPILPQPMPKELPTLMVAVAKKKFQPFHYELKQDKLTGVNKPTKTFLLRLRTSIPPDLSENISAPVLDGAATYRPIIVDPTSDGNYLVFYRDNPPRDLRPEKTKYLARLLTADGQQLWRLGLNPFLLSSSSEIHDVRLRGGVLYFNESCRNLRSPGPKCSTIVAVDPSAGKTIWRTPVHVSTNLFVFLDQGPILAAFGGGSGNSFAYLIDITTGKPISRTPLDGAMVYAEQQQGYVHLFTLDSHYIYRIGGESGITAGVSEPIADGTDVGSDDRQVEEGDHDPDEGDVNEDDEDDADEHDGLGEDSDDHGMMEDIETLRPADEIPVRSGRRGAHEGRK